MELDEHLDEEDLNYQPTFHWKPFVVFVYDKIKNISASTMSMISNLSSATYRKLKNLSSATSRKTTDLLEASKSLVLVQTPGYFTVGKISLIVISISAAIAAVALWRLSNDLRSLNDRGIHLVDSQFLQTCNTCNTQQPDMRGIKTCQAMVESTINAFREGVDIEFMGFKLLTVRTPKYTPN